MKREEKALVVGSLQERFSRASVALIASNRGLTVGQATQLRRAIRKAGGEYKVAKHTLVRRAVQRTRYERLGDFLRGPRGIAFGFVDPVAVAKALVEFAEQNDKLQIEGGAVEGQVIQKDQVKALAEMPGLDQLRARVVRQALSPGRRIAAMVTSPAGRIAGALEARIKQLEEAGGASQPE